MLPLPKLSVKNYDEMLGKLSFFQLVWAYASLAVIRSQVPAVDNFAHGIEQSEPWKSLQITNLAPAALLAFLGHAFRLHDQISKLFRIRKRFDLRHIVLPLAAMSGAQLSPSALAAIGKNRHPLMREIFYKYASSGSSKAKLVDEHDITKALTAWSWYWVCIEAIPYGLTLAAVLALFGALHAAAWTLAVAAAVFILSFAFRAELKRNAAIQLRQIESSVQAKQEIKSCFDAL